MGTLRAASFYKVLVRECSKNTPRGEGFWFGLLTSIYKYYILFSSIGALDVQMSVGPSVRRSVGRSVDTFDFFMFYKSFVVCYDIL